MPNKKRTSDQQTNIKVGNISGVSGSVNVAGRDITTHQTTTGPSAAELKQIFDLLYTQIDSRPNISSTDKEDLKAEVKGIQSTVSEAAQKNEKVEEGFLLRRFRNIARMAPDLLDVVVATLANPLAGLGVAANKLAKKAKEETGQV